MYSAKGIVNYYEDSVYVSCPKEIVTYYRKLVPKSVTLNPTKYDPHITVIRHEIIPDKTQWKKYEGQEVEFQYSSEIDFNEIYWWLPATCTFAENLREELGLPRVPPWRNNFHITIGNLK